MIGNSIAAKKIAIKIVGQTLASDSLPIVFKKR
jgi:hypothetical protein